MCEQSFTHTHADLAILGGVGITEEGIWNYHALIASALRRMMAAAGRTLFALDNTKFGRRALSLAAPFDSRVTIVTDVRPSPAVAFAFAIAAAGAKLTLAEKQPARAAP